MTHFLQDGEGQPVGMIDINAITDAGTQLAFRFAANCGDPAELERIGAEVLDRVGHQAFGYVAACALRTIAEHVLDPALTAGEAAGVHLRDGLTAIAEGRDPC